MKSIINLERIIILIFVLSILSLKIAFLPLYCYALSQPVNRYESIDKHALNTPESVEESIESLSSYLVESAKNDFEKTRAIYRWITQNISYDITGFLSGNYGDLTPEGVLKSRNGVCAGYATLFESMGKAAGLEIVKIYGYSKGSLFILNNNVDEGINHAWNAVKINEKWYLLDAAWGAGYMNEESIFIHKFNDCYFLTPPEQFIYDHFPENPKWQLLDNPISFEEFEQFVSLKPPFYYNNLKLISHTKNIIRTDNQVWVKLNVPDNVLLISKLAQGKTNFGDSLTYVHKINSNIYEINGFFPNPGEYILKIFAKHKDDFGKYKEALSYKIIANKGMTKYDIPITPKPEFFKYGIEIINQFKRLISTTDQAVVSLYAPDNVLLLSRLIRNNEKFR